MGIHASLTCVMSFGDHGGAEAILVGKGRTKARPRCS